MNRTSRVLGAALAVVAFAAAIRLLGGPASGDGSGPPPPPAESTPAPEAESSVDPFVIAGTWACPADWSYAAYDVLGHRVFAPNHPAHPSDAVRPDHCYGTEAEAEAAGYAGVPVGPDVQVVDGVYFVPVDLRARCERAATRLGFAVPCPTRLPNPRPGGTAPACSPSAFPPNSACVVRGDVPSFLFAYAAFSVPAAYQQPTNLVISAFRMHPRDADPFFDYAFLCSEGRVVGRSEPLDGAALPGGSFVQCPSLYPPPFAGQLILRWTQGGVMYQVSLNRDTPANRRLLESLVETSLTLVPPPPNGSP
jgi:hypothetical protein